MAVMPIIERELRVALRKKRPVRSRVAMASICAGGAYLFLWLSETGGLRSAGQTLHQLFCVAGLYFIVRTPARLAGLFAAERRQQTLGLLYLSGLGAGEVFASKALSSVAIAFNDLLAMLPMLALPFLMGGVSFDLFVATVTGLPNVLLFMLAISLLASVLSDDEGTATILAWVLTAGVCLAGPLIYLAQTQAAWLGSPSSWFLRTSPLYGPYLLLGKFGLASRAEFWPNFGLVLAWSTLSLCGAAGALKWIWREREADRDWLTPWKQRWQRFLHGEPRRRRRIAAEWLDANAFAWFAARDAQPARIAWLLVGGMGVVWLLGWTIWPREWSSPAVGFGIALVLNVGLQWIMRYAAARDLGNPRHDGTYEMLLTTPLKATDIVWGELEALKLLFRPILRTALIFEGILAVSSTLNRSWNLPAFVIFLVCWSWLLEWTWHQDRRWRVVLFTMWASVNCGYPGRALWRVNGLWRARGLILGWLTLIGFNWKWMLTSLAAFPTGSVGEISLLVLVGSIAFVICLARRDQATHWECRLVLELREIVCEPVPNRESRRFKVWDHRERFPWGWGVWQHQLLERCARRGRQEVHSGGCHP